MTGAWLEWTSLVAVPFGPPVPPLDVPRFALLWSRGSFPLTDVSVTRSAGPWLGNGNAACFSLIGSAVTSYDFGCA